MTDRLYHFVHVDHDGRGWVARCTRCVWRSDAAPDRAYAERRAIEHSDAEARR